MSHSHDKYNRRNTDAGHIIYVKEDPCLKTDRDGRSGQDKKPQDNIKVSVDPYTVLFKKLFIFL